MSKFAILTRIRPGQWEEDGEITVNIDQVAAIEEERGCAGRYTKITLSGGREQCVRGNHKDVRRAFVRQAASVSRHPSLWEDIFGHKANEALGWRR